MSQEIAKPSMKYSREFLLGLQHSAVGDPNIVEVLKPHFLDSGTPFPWRLNGSPSQTPEQENSTPSNVARFSTAKKQQAQTPSRLAPPSSTKRVPLAPSNKVNVPLTAEKPTKPGEPPSRENDVAPKRPMTFTPQIREKLRRQDENGNNKENVLNNTTNRVTASAHKSVQKPLQSIEKNLKTRSHVTDQLLKTPAPNSIGLTPQTLAPRTAKEMITPSKDHKDDSPSKLETDPHRLSQRQKQVTYGYRTLGYLRYRLLVPKENRGPEHPKTPQKLQMCSKRSWDGQVKKWRRELHKWDPEQTSGFSELVTQDVLLSIFEGVDDIQELIKSLKERLAETSPSLNDDDDLDSDGDVDAADSLDKAKHFKNSNGVARTLVF